MVTHALTMSLLVKRASLGGMDDEVEKRASARTGIRHSTTEAAPLK